MIIIWYTTYITGSTALHSYVTYTVLTKILSNNKMQFAAHFIGFVIVSLNATFGLPVTHAQLYSVLSLY